MSALRKEVIWRYGLSVGIFGLALLLTHVLWPLIVPSGTMLFFAAIMIAAYYGGLGPGLLTSVLSALAYDYFFAPPYNMLEVSVSNGVRASIFILVAVMISWLNATRKQLMRRISGFNEELQQKVEVATRELYEANESLRREIERHLETERNLKEQQERFEFVSRATNDMIYDWDVPSDMVWYNEAVESILGHPGGKVSEAKEKWLALVHPQDREGLINRFQTFLETKQQVWSAEYRLRLPDGTYATLHDQALLIYDEEGSPRRFVGTISNISARVEAEEARKNLLQGVVAAHEEERKRIARELHDQLSQQLISMNLKLEFLKGYRLLPDDALRQVKSLQETLSELSQEVNRIEHNLHPAALEGAELHEALKDYAEQWSEQTSISLVSDFNINGRKLSLPVKVCLYRVMQESLTNIYKHAEASQASISLKQRDGEIVLIVEDNGVGLNLSESQELFGKENGLGMRSMRERVELLGGRFEIESNPGKGTSLFARLPVEDKEKLNGEAEDITGR